MPGPALPVVPGPARPLRLGRRSLCTNRRDPLRLRHIPLLELPYDLLQSADRLALVFGSTHDAGRPYLLHSCGNLHDIMDDLIEDVGIDAKHSFEDTIETVVDAKATYGQRIALLGGIDVDFLCRADEAQIRQRVRTTLEHCQPGGGYCLGTGKRKNISF